MRIRSPSRKLSAANREAVEVAAALAREAVIQLHVDHALALVRHATGRVGPLRMLDIYIRVLDLSGTTAEIVANRVLAALGTGRARGTGERGASDDDASVLSVLRRRLRGRVHDELRRTVELTMGVVQKELLELHAARAHGFVNLVAGTHDIDLACALYHEHVRMPQPLADVLYIHVLARVASGQSTAALTNVASVSAAVPPRVAGRAALRAQRARTPA
jgi:hypothetical protein